MNEFTKQARRYAKKLRQKAKELERLAVFSENIDGRVMRRIKRRRKRKATNESR